MSQTLANALTSAALASSRSAQTYPKAPGVARSSFIRPPYAPRKGKGKGKEKQEEEEYDDDDEYYDPSSLSSRQKRLSRAARFGSSYSSSPVSLPNRWNDLVNARVERGDKQALQLDYKRRYHPDGGIRNVKDKDRATVLHLTSFAPYRYASIYSALKQVRSKLGPDEEEGEREERGEGSSSSSSSHSTSWTPSRIVEYKCGAAEGLWAAVNVFGNKAKDGKGIMSYVGYEAKTPFLKAGLEMYQAASKTTEEETDGTPLDETSRPGASPDLPLQGVNASFKPHSNTVEVISGSPPTLPLTSSGRDTLVICSYSLSTEVSDYARLKFVKNVWAENPRAEAIVFVEESDERGFAAIASAREVLLGLDLEQAKGGNAEEEFKVGRHVFYEVNEKRDDELPSLHQEPQTDRTECHVVAPCPHDKSCPLLHDYQFLEPPSNPTTRTSTANSPLFHGATLGMTTCSFPLRIHVPDYMRKTNNQSRADESKRYSYLVVRRGPRPSIAGQARSDFKDDSAFMARIEQLRGRAGRTKVGDIEEMRAGSKRDSITLAEEVGDHDLDGEDVLEEGPDDILAREELMKLLPAALREEMLASGDEDQPEMDEAMRAAHELMEKSARLAKTSDEEEDGGDDLTKSGQREQDASLSAAFIDQARLLREEGSGGAAEEEKEDKTLTASDFEAMRIESYQWPRLVQSALKKSGHVTFDVCSCSGSIDRFTLSKSSGKQVYQDSRKSNWGDSFPHIAFSDEEGETAFVKSLIVRVPPADANIRSNLPATFKMTQKRYKDIEKEKRMALTSAQAISPDRIAERRAAPEHYTKSMASTRRGHYEGTGDKERRSTRKRSLGYYDKAIQDAWRQDYRLGED
ncbi:hypothetical protein CBS101457_002675 [Exobasidium rhododendri]|nr:hypothetical protein CBS101457_002675 [Exobasidium rhododendri]